MTRILFSKNAGSTSCVSRSGRDYFFWTALMLPLFLVAILFYSFQSPVTLINQQAEVSAAQVWYESQHANSYFGEKKIQPNWSGAQAVRPKSDRLMIDVPLTNGSQFKHLLADPETGQANNAYRNGTTRLVLIKFGEGHYVPFLFHVFGNQPYITQHGLPASEANKPQSIQGNFSGCMLYTHLNGDFFYGLYLENGTIQKILMPQDGLVERDPEPYWWIHLNEVVITAHAFDLGGLGYGNINIIISGGGGDWWGNGPIEEDINNGGGFTPPICPDGSLMGPEGKCFCPDGSDMPASGECVASPVDPTGVLCSCVNLTEKVNIGELNFGAGFGGTIFLTLHLYAMDCNTPSTEGFIGSEISGNLIPMSWEVRNPQYYIDSWKPMSSPHCGKFVKMVSHAEIDVTMFAVGGINLLTQTYTLDAENTVPFY